MERNYIRAEKTAEKCMRISCTLWLVFIMAAATLIVLWPLEAPTFGIVILAACWLLALLYIIAAPHVRYERYRYCIDEEAIRVRSGLFWVSESIVPIERLHKLELSQGPVDRRFGLANVQVTTAGGDVSIKFLTIEKAEEIAETLKKKINTLAAAARGESADE